MLNSLRSRLLLSYLVVIATVLFIVALALLAVSSTQAVRVLPTLRQLSAITQGARRELVRLTEQRGSQQTIRQAIGELGDIIAAEQDVRLLIVGGENRRVLYDSQPGEDNWIGISLNNVIRPPGEFEKLDPSLPIGRFRASDGTRWLVFSQPLTIRGGSRLLLLMARPEPTVLQIFRQTFLRPLFLAALVAFLLSVLLAAAISGSVARPLKRLATASEAIAQGDYDQELPLQGPEEVHRVARSFNAMASQVAATQQAQRDFVANVSHDLKTPLTSIRGWSQALIDGTATDQDQGQRAAGIIHDEAERMERMVGQLLELARIESGQLNLARESVNLEQLINEVGNSFALQGEEKGVELRMFAQPVAPVSGDHDRLTQVLANLVDNALAYTPSGGEVLLRVHPHGVSAVEIIVQDSGPGIPAEDLNRIFERFYQVDKARTQGEERRGAGLGLAIAKELVEAHGGQITAHSQPGQGSAFVVRLPVEPPTGTGSRTPLL